VRTMPTLGALLKLMIEDFQAFFGGDRFWVALDITMDASKNQYGAPAIRKIVADYRQPIYARWTRRLIEMGCHQARAEDLVTMAASLISGMALRTLWNKADQEDKMKALWLPFFLNVGESK
jgi:hypothetical protein